MSVRLTRERSWVRAPLAPLILSQKYKNVTIISNHYRSDHETEASQTYRGEYTMNDVVKRVNEMLVSSNLLFSEKPILIGGMAMEYYEMRKSGGDIDLIITDDDYQALARKYPDQRKDLYGDLGVVIDKFEIWRSIAHLDYDFFKKDAIEEENILIVSIDRLLWTRVCAMEVEKYRKDLVLLKEY